MARRGSGAGDGESGGPDRTRPQSDRSEDSNDDDSGALKGEEEEEEEEEDKFDDDDDEEEGAGKRAEGASSSSSSSSSVAVFHGAHLVGLLHEADVSVCLLPAVLKAVPPAEVSVQHLIRAEIIARRQAQPALAPPLRRRR